MKKLFIVSLSMLLAVGCANKNRKASATVPAETVAQIAPAVPAAKAPDRQCRKWTDESDASHHSECTYRNTTLEEVYNIVRRENGNDYLQLPMPAADTLYRLAGDDGVPYLEIDHRYTDPHHVKIRVEWLESSGGSIIEIVEDEEGTVKTKVVDIEP
jgi:hypothetical protein